MHGVPAQPLSPEEIELLQIEWVGNMDTAGNMPLDVAHGFLTATAAEEQLKPLLIACSAHWPEMPSYVGGSNAFARSCGRTWIAATTGR
ncbi:MAG: hypothetical protein PVJ03_00685 [Chromatiaceae bacterium]|jgi:hypothetical protein